MEDIELELEERTCAMIKAIARVGNCSESRAIEIIMSIASERVSIADLVTYCKTARKL